MARLTLSKQLSNVTEALRREREAHELTRGQLANCRAEFEDVRRKLVAENQRLRDRNPPPPSLDVQKRIDDAEEREHDALQKLYGARTEIIVLKEQLADQCVTVKLDSQLISNIRKAVRKWRG